MLPSIESRLPANYYIVKFAIVNEFLIVGDHLGMIYRYLLSDITSYTHASDPFAPAVFVLEPIPNTNFFLTASSFVDSKYIFY